MQSTTQVGEGKYKLWKLVDCVFSVVKCLAVTIIVDTYLHVELNFRLKQNVHVVCRRWGENTFADNFANVLLGNLIYLRNGKDMICFSDLFLSLFSC